MKKFLPSFLIALVLLTGVYKFALADGTNVNLTIKNNGDVVYSGSVALLPAGTISINDSSGNPHDTNADSVLSIVNTADASSEEFNISNLIYYDAFGAFYLKCISVSQSELCDNWQYKVDGESPNLGMDSKILSGGENVLLYFGDENKAPEPEIETPPVHNGPSGSYVMPQQTILPPPVIPSPSPISIEPTLPLNINLEEKPKSVLPPAPKKQTKKINKITKQNIATITNSVLPAPIIIETPKKSWFRNLLDKIFSIF